MADDDVDELDDILMGSVLEFSQVAESGDFTAEEVLGDFVVNGGEVDLFNGYSAVWLTVIKPEVNIASASFPQELIRANAKDFIDGSSWLHYLNSLI